MSYIKKGRVRGAKHFRAKLSDGEVRSMREIYNRWVEAGKAGKSGAQKGYGAIGIIFGCSQWTARDICTYRTRIDA